MPRGPLAAPGYELAHIRDDATAEAGEADGLSPRTDVAVLSCLRATVALRSKVKAVRVERCEQCVVRVERGAVAGVELLRCRRVVVELGAPVSVVRVDDCDDVQIVASWAARVGYHDDSLAGPAAASAAAGAGAGAGAAAAAAAAAAADAPEAPAVGAGAVAEEAAAATGVGLSVLSTGSHAVTLVYPTHGRVDAPLREALLPETLSHRLRAHGGEEGGVGAVESRVVSPGSWGASSARVEGPRPAATVGGAVGGLGGGRAASVSAASGESPDPAVL